jgi:excisionase family DNA binding protein
MVDVRVLQRVGVVDQQPLIGTSEVAKLLGIPVRTVCYWAECQEIPAFKLGRRWRFRREEIIALSKKG